MEESGENHQTPLKKHHILELFLRLWLYEVYRQHVLNYSDLPVHSADVIHDYISFFV